MNSFSGSSEEMRFLLSELSLPTTPENIKGFQDIYSMSGAYNREGFISYLRNTGYIPAAKSKPQSGFGRLINFFKKGE